MALIRISPEGRASSMAVLAAIVLGHDGLSRVSSSDATTRERPCGATVARDAGNQADGLSMARNGQARISEHQLNWSATCPPGIGEELSKGFDGIGNRPECFYLQTLGSVA
jgi:hypothetical protein